MRTVQIYELIMTAEFIHLLILYLNYFPSAPAFQNLPRWKVKHPALCGAAGPLGPAAVPHAICGILPETRALDLLCVYIKI